MAQPLPNRFIPGERKGKNECRRSDESALGNIYPSLTEGVRNLRSVPMVLEKHTGVKNVSFEASLVSVAVREMNLLVQHSLNSLRN